jgi:hypothetical protein
MAFDWLKSSKTNYAKAIEQLQVQLKKRRNDPRLQLQLAEVFIQAKREKEALPLLEAVADEFALEGFAARAIAILKRIRSIDPTNVTAEEKLAYLISQQDNPMPSPWQQRREERPALDIGMEEIDDSALGMEMIRDEPAAEVPEGQAPAAGVTAAAAPPAPGKVEVPFGFDLSDDSVRHEFLELLDVAFSAEAPAASAGTATGVAASPLFSDFRPDELMAVIRGLKLHTFEPGEIVVSEGEAGLSLFIVASGRARAYLRDRSGRNVQVRELVDGDFFGEIALMTGGNRTATITAQSRCELLELDRATLDGVAAAHPRVREVLQEFYATRANTSVDAASRPGGAHA